MGGALGARDRGLREAVHRGGQRLRARRRLRARARVRLHLRQRERQVRPARGQARRHPRLRRHAAARAARRRREGQGAVLHGRHRSTRPRRCASASSTPVFPQAELMAKVSELAGRIAANGPLAVAECKRLIQQGQSTTLDARARARAAQLRPAVRHRGPARRHVGVPREAAACRAVQGAVDGLRAHRRPAAGPDHRARLRAERGAAEGGRDRSRAPSPGGARQADGRARLPRHRGARAVGRRRHGPRVATCSRWRRSAARVRRRA